MKFHGETFGAFISTIIGSNQISFPRLHRVTTATIKEETTAGLIAVITVNGVSAIQQQIKTTKAKTSGAEKGKVENRR
jgi:hypothetical protein